MIVPTLRVGMPSRTLRVRKVTQSVTGCVPTPSVGNDLHDSFVSIPSLAMRCWRRAHSPTTA
ncbi:hypothetical protein C1X27_04470 [Pseudomonas sp. MPR-AND1B]|nr:hypothetical protein CRN80_07915 [Pseudomonas sp. FDAARGOS_380]OWQ38897.1 hypothetical protein CDH05_24750 [Pseudomonas lactis]PMY76824.1 hypothetical protein C1X26_00085 [Pseudomonas sp. MPR-R3A]PMZ00325.1 hypothetical protein C1X24_01790 [Pseudomonas sp. FW305-124]PMZ76111.1 hypothetical protein C1X25_00085 [Pseudomonas sp. GW247-3R2A]PNA91094.1 hypothetical protein C1X23_18860 [Pseudomonas sp. FW300-E2]PNB04690.1 hypothetical protein C1X27_04470 [Pseudomonas sp. MPR-AND1B]PNY74997.1 hy